MIKLCFIFIHFLLCLASYDFIVTMIGQHQQYKWFWFTHHGFWSRYRFALYDRLCTNYFSSGKDIKRLFVGWDENVDLTRLNHVKTVCWSVALRKDLVTFCESLLSQILFKFNFLRLWQRWYHYYRAKRTDSFLSCERCLTLVSCGCWLFLLGFFDLVIGLKLNTTILTMLGEYLLVASCKCHMWSLHFLFSGPVSVVFRHPVWILWILSVANSHHDCTGHLAKFLLRGWIFAVPVFAESGSFDFHAHHNMCHFYLLIFFNYWK